MLKNKRNLYLMGFMGCGKTFIGQKLAKELAWSFCDLDERIEAIEKSSVSSIFETKGEAYFRRLERDCLMQTAKDSKTVVALGGGTPCFFDNIEWIKLNGSSLFLDVAPQVLMERLLNESNKRPLVKGKNKEELMLFIHEKLEERRSFYEQADHTFSASHFPIENIGSFLKENLLV